MFIVCRFRPALEEYRRHSLLHVHEVYESLLCEVESGTEE
jgi:hypothetical protein